VIVICIYIYNYDLEDWYLDLQSIMTSSSWDLNRLEKILNIADSSIDI